MSLPPSMNAGVANAGLNSRNKKRKNRATRRGSSSSSASCCVEKKDSLYYLNLSRQRSLEHKPKKKPAIAVQFSNMLPYDVMLGRSSMCFNNVGNRRFRIAIELHVPQYHKLKSSESSPSCSKARAARTAFIHKLCQFMLQEVGYRFLKFHESKSFFVVATESEARQKIGHAIRDQWMTYRKQKEQETSTSTSLWAELDDVNSVGSTGSSMDFSLRSDNDDDEEDDVDDVSFSNGATPTGASSTTTTTTTTTPAPPLPPRKVLHFDAPTPNTASVVTNTSEEHSVHASLWEDAVALSARSSPQKECHQETIPTTVTDLDVLEKRHRRHHQGEFSSSSSFPVFHSVSADSISAGLSLFNNNNSNTNCTDINSNSHNRHLNQIHFNNIENDDDDDDAGE
eukprot:scaffold3716_cov69-Cylindrotheca_fusiformis.AAC.15